MKRAVPPVIVLSILGLNACSLDVLPVHYSRVNAARADSAQKNRAPASVQGFTKNWTFAMNGGYRYDPTRLEIKGGTARLKETAPGKYPLGDVVLETNLSRPFEMLDGFVATTAPGSENRIRYQVSNDGSRWFWFNGTQWVSAAANSREANSASDLNEHLRQFHLDVGVGSVALKIYMNSPTGKEPVELQAFSVAGTAPRTDGWD